MIKFEKVSRFLDEDITLPERSTAGAAGYDFFAAEDVIIPSYVELYNLLNSSKEQAYVTLEEIEKFTKALGARPTLISTGVKCALNSNTYLEIASRSSSPLKYWILCANSIGIIDSDYYNNPSNEGEIFFQAINLSPYHIKIKTGDRICQGIIKPYLTTDDDACAQNQRNGGFGSTGN